MKRYIQILTALFLLNIGLSAQNYVFFNDSPNNTYYETSWGFNAGGSTLELINGSKFPVDATIKYSGTNSLRLKWKSVTGGDWGIAVAGQNWVARDVTQMDSIAFYVYS